VLPPPGAVVFRPHLPGDLQGLLQALEALGGAGEGDSQAAMLALEPGGADSKPGPPSREHVQGGGLLDQQTRKAIGHPGHHRAQAHPPGVGRHEGQGGIALQHVHLGRADVGDLEEVVHDPEAGEAHLFGAPGDPGQGGGEFGGSAGPG